METMVPRALVSASSASLANATVSLKIEGKNEMRSPGEWQAIEDKDFSDYLLDAEHVEPATEPSVATNYFYQQTSEEDGKPLPPPGQLLAVVDGQTQEVSAISLFNSSPIELTKLRSATLPGNAELVNQKNPSLGLKWPQNFSPPRLLETTTDQNNNDTSWRKTVGISPDIASQTQLAHFNGLEVSKANLIGTTSLIAAGAAKSSSLFAHKTAPLPLGVNPGNALSETLFDTTAFMEGKQLALAAAGGIHPANYSQANKPLHAFSLNYGGAAMQKVSGNSGSVLYAEQLRVNSNSLDAQYMNSALAAPSFAETAFRPRMSPLFMSQEGSKQQLNPINSRLPMAFLPGRSDAQSAALVINEGAGWTSPDAQRLSADLGMLLNLQGPVNLPSTANGLPVSPGTVAANQTLGSVEFRAAQSLAEFQDTSSKPLPFGHRNWSQQFTQQVTLFASQHRSQAQMILDPPELGPIQVHLRFDTQQVLQLQFKAAHAEVRDAIEQSLIHLQESLKGEGIMMSSANIESLESGEFQQDNASSNREDSAPPDASSSAEEKPPTPALLLNSQNSDTGIDIFA